MEARYDVTIGLPVYNVEKYIRRSLLSALDQDFNGEIEIFIVNDCTKDQSMSIIEELKNIHPKGKNIHLINQPENKGLSAARNEIIENFHGKYLFFMDSDDYISKDCIRKLFVEAEAKNADVVYGALATIDEKGNPLDIGQDYLIQEYKALCNKDEFASFAFQNMHQHLRDYVTNVLFRDAFIKNNNLKFKNVRFYEDVMFSADLVPLVEIGIIIPDITYYYIIRHNSLSNYQGRLRIELDEIKTFIYIFNYIKNKNKELKDKPYYEARCARSMVQMLFILSGVLKNRKVITPPLTYNMIKDAMKHPASFSEIIKFKRYKLINLAFYIIGILPSFFSVYVIILIAKYKRLI